MPIHVWFGVALVVIAIVPALAASATYLLQDIQRQAFQQTVQRNVAQARVYLTTNVHRWHDHAWQAAARARLRAWGLEAQLTDAGGRAVFENTRRVPPNWHGVKIVIRKPANKPGIIGGGAIYYPPPASQTWAGPLLSWLIALIAVLAAIAWILGRAVVGPLAAASRVARGITDGNLDAHVPPSSVKEVTDVSIALQVMSSSVRDSLRRQESLERERRLFIGAIAHDLRTPLFTLRSYLGGLRGGLASTPEKADRYVEICQAKAGALDRLVTDLFDFARLEYLDQAPELEPVDLSRVFGEAAGNARIVAERKAITISLRGSADRCPVLADAHLLHRAIGNLLDNALRYSPAGGDISIHWARDANRVTFSVEDSGSGISDSDLPHLFTPLYRGEESRNRRTGGAGLGLTIARGIVRAHGGDLTIGNRPGGGAVVSGVLPLPAGGATPVWEIGKATGKPASVRTPGP